MSFQIFGCVDQTLVDYGKSSIDVLILDILANLWLPVVNGLGGEKMHETE
jgi:hypothetical protein